MARTSKLEETMINSSAKKYGQRAKERDNYIVNKIKSKNLATMIVVVKYLINITFTSKLSLLSISET